MTDHPIARQMLGYLFVRGGVHALAYAKALEELTGATVTKMLNMPNSAFPETKKWEDQGSHRTLYRFSEPDFTNLLSVCKGVHPRGGRGLARVRPHPHPAGFPRSSLIRAVTVLDLNRHNVCGHQLASLGVPPSA